MLTRGGSEWTHSLSVGHCILKLGVAVDKDLVHRNRDEKRWSDARKQLTQRITALNYDWTLLSQKWKRLT